MGGGVFRKKWTFPQRRVHYVQYQYFLFYILLIGGAYAPNAPPPLPTGLHYIILQYILAFNSPFVGRVGPQYFIAGAFLQTNRKNGAKT